MTDTEIIKAFECCYLLGKSNPCKDCPAKSGCEDDYFYLENEMYSIINRQQAEIEKLKTENLILSQKRANIFEISDAYSRGRTDGIKEFAERLKEDLRYCETIVGENGKFGYPSEEINDTSDNLLKEMGVS